MSYLCLKALSLKYTYTVPTQPVDCLSCTHVPRCFPESDRSAQEGREEARHKHKQTALVGPVPGIGKEKQEVHPTAWAEPAGMRHYYHTLVLIILFIEKF